MQRFPEYTKGLCALTLRPSRDGSLWIGTDGGLFHWANNRMTHIGRDSGLTLNADGSFVYKPANNYTGTDTFTYKVRDITGLESNVATVMITIKP